MAILTLTFEIVSIVFIVLFSTYYLDMSFTKLPILARRLSVSKEQAAGFELIKAQAKTLLQQKKSVLTMIKPSDYVHKNERIYNSSIGSHIRHSLDHFQCLALIINISTKKVANYDERQRKTEVETNPLAALVVIEQLELSIRDWDLSQSVDVSFIADNIEFNSYTVPSTLARELSFVAHHAVHHMSMVKLLLQELGYDLSSSDSSNLGIAMSTAKDIKNRQEKQQQYKNN